MEKEEYDKLNPGDHVWVCKLRFSTAGTLTLSMLAELEKIEGMDNFKVVKVERGTSLREGKEVKGNSYYTFYISSIYKTRKDAIKEWNKNIYNTIDRLTSTYEQTMKRIKKKIISE
jgi:hypothetical protein